MRRTTQAFTLIELLIVVAIIAILALIAVPNFLEAQTRAKVSRTKTDMRTVVVGIEAYRVDNLSYPLPSYTYSTNGATDSTFEIDNVRQGVQSMTNSIGVTTPVAYLTSLPHDVFSPEKVHWFGYCTNIGGSGQGGPNSGGNIGGSGPGSHWILTSLGPNMTQPDIRWQDWQGGEIEEVKALEDPNYHLVNLTYDPTNGTVSAGDIWRSNVDLNTFKRGVPQGGIIGGGGGFGSAGN